MNPRDLGKYFYIQISDTSKVGPKYYVRKEVALDPQLETLTGTSLPETMSLDEAKQLFNHFSDFTVKDPLGYYNTEDLKINMNKRLKTLKMVVKWVLPMRLKQN